MCVCVASKETSRKKTPTQIKREFGSLIFSFPCFGKQAEPNCWLMVDISRVKIFHSEKLKMVFFIVMGRVVISRVSSGSGISFF